jgi:hypothetical protein
MRRFRTCQADGKAGTYFNRIDVGYTAVPLYAVDVAHVLNGIKLYLGRPEGVT